MLFLSGRQKHLERLLKFDMGRPWTRHWDAILEFEPDDNRVNFASIGLNEKGKSVDRPRSYHVG